MNQQQSCLHSHDNPMLNPEFIIMDRDGSLMVADLNSTGVETPTGDYLHDSFFDSFYNLVDYLDVSEVKVNTLYITCY